MSLTAGYIILFADTKVPVLLRKKTKSARCLSAPDSEESLKAHLRSTGDEANDTTHPQLVLVLP